MSMQHGRQAGPSDCREELWETSPLFVVVFYITAVSMYELCFQKCYFFGDARARSSCLFGRIPNHPATTGENLSSYTNETRLTEAGLRPAWGRPWCGSGRPEASRGAATTGDFIAARKHEKRRGTHNKFNKIFRFCSSNQNAFCNCAVVRTTNLTGKYEISLWNLKSRKCLTFLEVFAGERRWPLAVEAGGRQNLQNLARTWPEPGQNLARAQTRDAKTH